MLSVGKVKGEKPVDACTALLHAISAASGVRPSRSADGSRMHATCPLMFGLLVQSDRRFVGGRPWTWPVSCPTAPQLPPEHGGKARITVADDHLGHAIVAYHLSIHDVC